jgi:hypothetical protein
MICPLVRYHLSDLGEYHLLVEVTSYWFKVYGLLLLIRFFVIGGNLRNY